MHNKLLRPDFKFLKMFRFNFGSDSVNQNDKTEGKPTPQIEAEELDTDLTQIKHMPAMDAVEVYSDIKLLKGSISSEAAANTLGEALNTSDLIPGQYEGGFKLWEGSLDLCQFLCEKFHLTSDLLKSETDIATALQGKKVLELGCGHGLPGILALLAGAEVHFQDYNKEVLTSLTIPNVLANRQRLPRGRRRPQARFFAGGWGSLGELLGSKGLGGYYDYILTAETIYSQSSQEQLLSCMQQVLQPPHGHIYLAAKSYYFGVVDGGAVSSFKKLVRSNTGPLECSTVKTIEDPTSTKREVLQLNFPEFLTPYFL